MSYRLKTGERINTAVVRSRKNNEGDNSRKDERCAVLEHFKGIKSERYHISKVSLTHYSSSYMIFGRKEVRP